MQDDSYKATDLNVTYVGLCDSAYAVASLATSRSLERWGAKKIFVYGMDSAACELLEKTPNNACIPVPPTEFMTAEIAKTRHDRSHVGFAFTLKPAVLKHAASAAPKGEWLVYLDSDVWAFSDPREMFALVPSSCQAVFTPHRFSPNFAKHEPTVGRFNAGIVAFRNTVEGMRILDRWLELCIDWCDSIVSADRYADQKYLDVLEEEFSTVADCSHPGVNVAPWNAGEFQFALRDNQVHCDEIPLILYHFQGLKWYAEGVVDGYASEQFQISTELRELVYRPYVNAIAAARADFTAANPDWIPKYKPCGLRRRFHLFTQRHLLRSSNEIRLKSA